MILICAAGASSRMAPIDKLMLPIDGKPLLRRVVQNVLQAKLPIIVALPPRPHARWQALSGLQLSVTSYADSLEGLSGTLRATVANLPKDISHLCIVLADLPGIRAEDISNVFEEVVKHPNALIWRPIGPEGQPAHPTVFHRHTFSAFAKISGDAGAKDVIEKFRSHTFKFINKTDSGSMDIDHPEDYQSFLKQSDATDLK